MTPPHEGVFTAPSPECPHPGRWHAPDSEATELEVTGLVAALVTALRPDLVVETGTYTGDTAEAIGQALAAAGHGHLHTVEINPGRAEAARRRLEGLPVTVHCGSSVEYQPPGKIDFAWLDSHPRIRAAEVRHLRPYVYHRTIIGVHDTGPQHVVRPMIEDLVGEGLLTGPLWLPTPRGLCLARVTPGGPQ